MMHDLKINLDIQEWMHEARSKILKKINEPLLVDVKSGPNDLVTNVDKEIENFYRYKIVESYPDSNIFGEEGNKDISAGKKYLWVIDPIDGTMNFVKEKKNFASMIAVFKDNKPYLAYIYDIINDDLYWGGPALNAVYCNSEQITSPKDTRLKDGLVDISCVMLLKDKRNVLKVIKQSSGLRVYGSAAIGFINVINGGSGAYFSHLNSWDYLPGNILAETLGLVVKKFDDDALNMVSSTDVLVATNNTYREIMKLIS